MLEDYCHALISFLTFLPPVTFSSPALHLATSHTLSALTCPAPPITSVALDVLGILAQNMNEAQLPPIFVQYGKAILTLCLGGVVQDFPEGTVDPVKEIVGAVCQAAPPAEVEVWAQEAMASVPGHVLPLADKQAFLAELQGHLAAGGQGDKLKTAIVNMVRASRRAKERGRQARKSLGAP